MIFQNFNSFRYYKRIFKTDKVIYLSMIIWTVGWSLTFIIGTLYNLSIKQLSRRMEILVVFNVKHS